MPFQRPHIFRPPSEWMSYYLPLTSGCSNNTCTFCTYYGSKLQVRDIEDVKKEIDALALYTKRGLRLPDISYVAYAIAQQWDGRRVFLQDGDALVYPFPKLKETLQYLNEKFPHLERISTYATAQDILRRSVSELEELRDLKASMFYMGVESGHNEVLDSIGKGVHYDELVEAGRKVKEAGIILSITVILGLGGVELSQEHAMATARIMTDLDPEFVGALTLSLVPGTPLHEQVNRGSFRLISPFRSLEELKVMVENSRFSDCFFSSMHASNYFSVRGRLPQDREKMIQQLETILTRKDPHLLRPEFMRGL
ncbi:MAG: radical SAM protein [Chloroflexota bacterium]|nr:radical SAM protein [Chloroflexota bacterium]